MDPWLLEKAITPRTKAIIPVHLYGQMADMDAIMEISRKHKLPVIEDACQAHGAEYKGRKAGSIGDVGCFSFYPGKNLGACGEGGACVTNSVELKDKMATFRDHGQAKKYYHQVVGWNGRMDGIQGAILSIKLKHLNAWTEARRSHAKAYSAALTHTHGVLAPKEASYGKHVYHLYVIQHPRRDELLAFLKDEGVRAGLHYPIPVHLQPCYEGIPFTPDSLSVTESLAKTVISLPMYPELTSSQIEFVCDRVREFPAN
jgi:dTDP-4-amino-4,6-dideoxygalactose transaminase